MSPPPHSVGQISHRASSDSRGGEMGSIFEERGGMYRQEQLGAISKDSYHKRMKGNNTNKSLQYNMAHKRYSKVAIYYCCCCYYDIITAQHFQPQNSRRQKRVVEKGWGPGSLELQFLCVQSDLFSLELQLLYPLFGVTTSLLNKQELQLLCRAGTEGLLLWVLSSPWLALSCQHRGL